MSINDFENVEDLDFSEEVETFTLAGVKSNIGKSTARALKAKQSLNYAISEAIDASTDFGYELGRVDERERIVKIIDEKLGHVNLDELLNLINGE
jgi:hypothetical protein